MPRIAHLGFVGPPPRNLRMFTGMEKLIYRLARAGGIETNPTTYTQRAGSFASAVANTGTATLLTRRDGTGLNGYLILPGNAAGHKAEIHLAHTVGAEQK